MTTHAILLGLGAFALAWSALCLWARRDLRLASVLLLILSPLAVKVALGGGAGKVIVAAACAAPLPGLVLGLIRARQREAFEGHPLFPFVLLYAAAVVYGLAWALLRGNDPVLALGQSFTGALLACGFFLAGPVLARQATPRFWLLFAIALGGLMVPGLVPFVSWLTADEPALIRFVDAPALYATLAVFLSLAVVAPRHRVAGVLGAAGFLLVTVLTFTRSYWIGLVAGALLLGGFWLVAATRRPRRVPRPSLRGAALALAVAVPLVALVVATPLADFVVDRVLMTHRGSGDLSVDVRALELSAAIEELRASSPLGIGSGGEFLSLYHTGGIEVSYGPRSFVHNAYLYFPLKFGVLGFAVLFALAGGFLAALVSAARRTRAHGAGAGGFVALFAVVLTASITAPHLVDPVYSVFAGALAYLAGAPVPRPSPAAQRTPWAERREVECVSA